MVDVATLTVKVDTTDLARAEAALEALTKEGKLTASGLDRLKNAASNAGDATGGLNRGMGAATKGSGAFGRSIQNSAFQVGDFAVQVGSGQRASVALAQQLPQLLGGFGVLGAVLGALVAIGVPLTAFFLRAEKGAEDVGSAVDELAQATTDLNRALKAFSAGGLSDAVEKYGEMNAEILLLLDRQEKLAANDALKRAADAVAALRNEYVDSWLSTDEKSIADLLDIEMSVTQLDNFGNKVLTINPIVRDFQQALLDIEAAKSFEGQADAAAVLIQFLEAAGENTSDIYRDLVLAEAEFRRLAQTAETAQGPLAVFVEAATSIRDRFREAVEAASQLPGAGAALDDNAPTTSPRPPRRGVNSFPEDPTTMPTSSAPDVFARQIEALNKSLMTERETVEAWRSENLALLEGYNDQELALMGLHKDARLRIEEEYQERLGDLREKERAARVQSIAGAFGDVASLMQTNSKKLLNIGKTAAIAEATINGYEAATEAWSKGMKLGGPPVAAAFTAASLARTGSLISAINSTSFGSGGGGGAGGVSAAPAVPDTSARVALTLVGNDNATFTGKQVRDLINAINEEVEGGSIVRLA